MTPVQKRNKSDFDMANEIMSATSALMKLINKAREEHGLYVGANLLQHPFSAIRICVRREFKNKSTKICDAEIGT